MNRETSKSILLAALVILSLFLTWSIWTYQGNFESKSAENAPDIKPIDSEHDPNFSDVVRPYQLTHFTNKKNGLLGTDNRDVVDLVYREILNVKWTMAVGVPNVQNEQSSYEMVFPAPVKLDTIQSLFDFSSSKTSLRHDWLIDRVSIYQQKTQTVLVFKGVDETPKFSATSTEMALKDVEDKENINKYFSSYKEIQIKGKQVFIPIKSIQYNELTYPYTLVDIKNFKPIFFSDPEKTYYSNNAYSDGDSILKQDDNNYVLKYVNPATGGNNVLRDPIYQGYSYINSHKGWTDIFSYDYYDSRLGENVDSVDFRLTAENGLPVYSVSGFPAETLISLTWENGVLYKLDRTLLNIGKQYDSKPKTIYSWDDVQAILKIGHIPVNGLQDLRVGYNMDINAKQQIVTLTPDWFFKTNDHWQSLQAVAAKNSPAQSNNGGGDQ
jgi:regulatory protein YycH of two-component signal transduction system YycFG